MRRPHQPLARNHLAPKEKNCDADACTEKARCFLPSKLPPASCCFPTAIHRTIAAGKERPWRNAGLERQLEPMGNCLPQAGQTAKLTCGKKKNGTKHSHPVSFGRHEPGTLHPSPPLSPPVPESKYGDLLSSSSGRKLRCSTFFGLPVALTIAPPPSPLPRCAPLPALQKSWWERLLSRPFPQIRRLAV